MTEQINLSQIRTDGGTQARAGLNKETVREYQELLDGIGGVWPYRDPITLYHDGNDYWLADGFHRVEACKRNGRFVAEADVRQGTQRDAILHAAGANAAHGLRRTYDDKRRAVLRLLEDAEWGQWSDREIARRCKVSHPFVANIRRDTGNVTSERKFTDRHGNDTVMQTKRIGSGQPAYVEVWELENVVRGWVSVKHKDSEVHVLQIIKDKTVRGNELWKKLNASYVPRNRVYRERDLRQACNNVLQQLKDASPPRQHLLNVGELQEIAVEWIDSNGDDLPGFITHLDKLGGQYVLQAARIGFGQAQTVIKKRERETAVSPTDALESHIANGIRSRQSLLDTLSNEDASGHEYAVGLVQRDHDLSADEIREAARVLNEEHAPAMPDPVREIDEIIRAVERLMIKHKSIDIIGPLSSANVQLYAAQKAIKETAVEEES